MDITFTIKDEHLSRLRQRQEDETKYDPATETNVPTGQKKTVDQGYAWAEVKFHPVTGEIMYVSLREQLQGDDRHSRIQVDLVAEANARSV